MSNWKIPYFSLKNKLIFFSDFSLYVSRNSTVTEGLINKKVLIHTGKKYIFIIIKAKHVGLKFGELFFVKVIPYLRAKKAKGRKKRK